MGLAATNPPGSCDAAAAWRHAAQHVLRRLHPRAQKDSRPFIQAALAKGEVAGTAASLISNFIDGRIRSEGELQADVALAGADAALEGEVTRLSRVADPASVFNDDITNFIKCASSIKKQKTLNCCN